MAAHSVKIPAGKSAEIHNKGNGTVEVYAEEPKRHWGTLGPNESLQVPNAHSPSDVTVIVAVEGDSLHTRQAVTSGYTMPYETGSLKGTVAVVIR